jgi:ribosomal protein S18 acetylase RimI-like enzyme
VLEPAFCHVILHGGQACGYVMGTPDTESFDRRFESEWLPRLRQRVARPPADETGWKGFDWLRHRIHHPDFAFNQALAPYPAQGHIDLLPLARGKGVGRAAMIHLMTMLARTGAPGIHLHVSPQNTGGQAFYRSLGFHTLVDARLPSHTLFMARALP